MENTQTIAAITTASGVGAIGVIRLSGAESIVIANGIFKGKNLTKQSTHTLHFGKLIDPKTKQEIDEVVVSIFKNPQSYTGEDVVEISAHGSPYILQQILGVCLANGARLANPGEFTQRAFLNGKMDLSQAEAVADLIASDSKASHELAMNQMRGGFSLELSRLRESLINFAALIELELDFSEEDVEFADRESFNKTIQQLKSVIQQLIQSFEYGNVIKEGVPVAIAGKPNAGKSSLLNALFDEEKAIVSEIAGTTRDTIEDVLTIEGIKFRFIDTAGLRETDDKIEAIGVQKAKDKVTQAKILIYLFDLSNTTPQEVIQQVESFYREDLIIILAQTHVDLYHNQYENLYFDIANALTSKFYSMFGLALKGEPLESTLQLLKLSLVKSVEGLKTSNNVVVSNARHLEALQHTMDNLTKVENGLKSGISGDFLAQDIRSALYYLGLITGEIDVDTDILGTIFGKFCIGK